MTSANLFQKTTAAKFYRGLVVGKFCPLHLGHELLINTALQQCDELILISYSKPEVPGYERKRRHTWLQERFPRVILWVLDDHYLQQEAVKRGINDVPLIPDNDDSDHAQRIFVGWLCQHLFRTRVDAVFTSEDYGEGFAKALTQYFQRFDTSAPRVTHICVDKPRKQVPVSGTDLRANLYKYRRFLAPDIYAGFIERVCFLGGECSGKTTLAACMARELNTCWVPEFGRELWEQKGGKLQYDDMVQIGATQINREQGVLPQANRWLFCDTSPLTTLFYSQELFGRTDERLRAMAEREYQHLFLCAPDFEFVQDNTRTGDAFRQRQHQWYLAELKRRKIPFNLLTGNFQMRMSTVTCKLAAKHP